MTLLDKRKYSDCTCTRGCAGIRLKRRIIGGEGMAFDDTPTWNGMISINLTRRLQRNPRDLYYYCDLTLSQAS